MKTDERSIFLVGMMAVGKTTVGRNLAELLGFQFRDADQLVEERAGVDISWIFDQEGESGFRDREQLAIETATKMPRTVLATGGGAVLRAENRRAMQERGVVVYLKASADLLIERASRDHRRPLLQVDDVDARIQALLCEREPLYAEVAHLTVAASRRSASSVAANIVEQLRDLAPIGTQS